VLLFLSRLFGWGHESALNVVGGSHLKRIGSPDEDPVFIELEIGDIVWSLRFPMTSTGMAGHYGEELRHKGKLILRAGMSENAWYLGTKEMPHDEMRCCTKVLWDRGESDWLRPLFNLLNGIRIYKSYWLNQVQRLESVDSKDSFLHGTGRNLWSVLSNWKGAAIRYRGQFDWVMTETRKAFPGLFHTAEFDRGLPFLYGPDATDPADGLPPSRAPDGLLTGLLHLTAVAGAHPGAVIAIDEMENQLHPHAIRSILAAMRSQAEERNLTIILTTHSPVLMNEYKGQEDQLFLLKWDSSSQTLPITLYDELGPDWLAHFSPGDLYDNEEFGSPRSEG